jgi:hypothetical protein
MHVVVAAVTLIAGLVAWVGQSLAAFAPDTAERLGVLEPRDELDPMLYLVETKVMGLSDLMLAWTLPASGGLLLLDHPAWPYLALFGSGVFIYFSVVIILNRLFGGRAGHRVGRPASRRAAYVFGAIWIGCSVAMSNLAVAELTG